MDGEAGGGLIGGVWKGRAAPREKLNNPALKYEQAELGDIMVKYVTLFG